MTEIIRMSSKGQIVIPKNLRDELGVETASAFAVFGQDDVIVLKKVDVPNKEELFEQLNTWGVAFAKKKNIKEKDVVTLIHKRRRT